MLRKGCETVSEAASRKPAETLLTKSGWLPMDSPKEQEACRQTAKGCQRTGIDCYREDVETIFCNYTLGRHSYLSTLFATPLPSLILCLFLKLFWTSLAVLAISD